MKEGRGGGSFQTIKCRFNLYMEKILRTMALKKEKRVLHLVLQYRLFKTLCLIQSWGKTSKGDGKMIGTKCILSEYNLKARITLMLLIWLERLHFLVSSQHWKFSVILCLYYRAYCTCYNEATNNLGGGVACFKIDSIECMQNMWQGLWSQGLCIWLVLEAKTRTNSILSLCVSKATSDDDMQSNLLWFLS